MCRVLVDYKISPQRPDQMKMSKIGHMNAI